MEITPISIITESHNHVLARKKHSDNEIHIISAPASTHIRIDIDADIETVGCAAYILMHRYKEALESYKQHDLVPANTDEIIKEQVDEYLGCGRTGIVMIRKDEKNGQN